MDESAFNNYLGNLRSNATVPVQNPTQVMPQPQAPAQQGGGNWLTHLLPTAGSIGGGIGGAALGTAILPGIGTIAGGILGAAFGGGGAKAAENATEGKGIGNGVETSAVEGGVGQALGGVAGKVLGKGAELLASRAGGITRGVEATTSNAAADKATQDAITNRATAVKDVNPTLQGNLNAADSLDHVKAMGFDDTNPLHVQQVGQTTNDILNDSVNSALAAHGPIDTSNYNDTLKNILSQTKYKNLLGDMQPVAISRARMGLPNNDAVNLYKQLSGLGEGVTGLNSDPIALRQLSSDLYNMAQDAKPGVAASTGAKDPAQVAKFNAINEVRDHVKGLIDNPTVNSHLQNLAANIVPGDVGGSQPLADHINSIISSAGKNGNSAYQDYMNGISKNIDINKLGTEMKKANQIVSSTGAQARAAADLNGDGIPDNTQQPSIPEVAGNILHGPGGPLGVAGRALTHGANNPAILNTLSRMGELTAKLAPAAGVVAATAPNLAADPLAAPQQSGTMGATMQPAQQSPLDQLYQTLMQNYQAGGGITSNDASIAGTLATLAPQVQKQNLVSGELSALPGAFANAGGAQGAGGILSHIAGLIPGTAAHTYQQQQQGAAQALAAQLGISPQAAMGLLPQLMQNQQTAGQSLGVLGQLTGRLAY